MSRFPRIALTALLAAGFALPALAQGSQPVTQPAPKHAIVTSGVHKVKTEATPAKATPSAKATSAKAGAEARTSVEPKGGLDTKAAPEAKAGAAAVATTPAAKIN
jgi:hypothetical protein